MSGNVIVASLLISLGLAGAALADPKEEVLAAAKKVADSESYSWTTTAEGGGGMGAGGSEGKTQKDGLTLLVLNLRSGSANVLFKGEKGAVETPDEGWQAIPALDPDRAGPRDVLQMVAAMIRTYRAPANQALNLASKSEDLQKFADDSYSGTLPPDEAQALMQRRAGRREGTGPDVKDAKATVSFWTKDGMLTKFQFHVQGTMTMQGEERQIDRTTTVQIKDVGTTKMEVPEAAQALMR